MPEAGAILLCTEQTDKFTLIIIIRLYEDKDGAKNVKRNLETSKILD